MDFTRSRAVIPTEAKELETKSFSSFSFSPIFTSFGATDGNRDESRHLKRHLWTPDR